MRSLWGGAQDIALCSQLREQRGNHLLAQGVQWRVGHLGEALSEVVVQHSRAIGQRGDRRIRTHGTGGFSCGDGHRTDEGIHLFLGVAEHALAQHDALVVHRYAFTGGQLFGANQVVFNPLLVRLLKERGLHFFIGVDLALGSVHQEHATGLHAGALHDIRIGDFQHACLGSHHHEAILGDADTAGAQTIAVQHRADHGAVGKGQRSWSIPRLHEGGVVFVEATDLRIQVLVALPCLGNHHQHSVWQ